MFLHRSSASEQRACHVPPLKAALWGGGMGEDGMLLAFIQDTLLLDSGVVAFEDDVY